MDTIDLRFDSIEAATTILHEVTCKTQGQDASRFRRSEEWSYQEPIKRRWRGYRKRLVFQRESRKVFLAYDPLFDGEAPLRMSVNASHFDNFAHLSHWLDDLLGSANKHLQEAVITRIDAAIDLCLPHEAITISLDARSRKLWAYSSKDGHSLQLGTRPKYTLAYSKEIPTSKLDWMPRAQSPEELGEKIMGTRIEVRRSGVKVPAKRWSDLPRMTTENPFKGLHLLPVAKEIPKASPDGRIPTVVWAYIFFSEKTSGAVAKRMFNRGGHFKKTVGRHLVPAEPIDFAAAWRNRCERFFGRQHITKEGVTNENSK